MSLSEHREHNMDEEPSTSAGIKSSIPKELQDELDLIAANVPRDIVNPTDLSDNQKRWLVVGICLHNVLAPALRIHVNSILTSLYNQLSCNHKIDTQIHSNHLKQYPPTNTYLNYENVNNNKANHGYQKANYDYTIKNAVDLSRLFLQTHMAHYTGFDETCDSSALLGLIINIDKFSPVVKSDAEDVRTNIRNQWAHCDYTKWDAVKYSTSFQLMEKFVRDISPIDENQVIGKLNKWKTEGSSFLIGITLVLVNEIRQQTQVLAEYANLVATETDEKILGIKKELQNKKDQLKEIYNKVMDQEKTLNNHETKFEEVKESLKLCSCYDSHNIEIESWKEESEKFVDTPVVNMISQIIESETNVLIVGEPGIGKSFLMHHVALHLHTMMEYNIIPCSGIRDIVKHYKENVKQMFVLDDICGRYTTSLFDAEYLIKNENTLKLMLKKKIIKVLATCRLDIYSEELFQESCTVFTSNIFNLSAKYSRDDKLTICSKYLTEANIQLLKDENVQFTPLMCYLYSNSQTFNLTDFLQSPFETYQMEWNKLKSYDPHKYCALFLCVIYNGIMRESLFDIYNENNTENKDVFENVFEICEINRCTSRSKIKRVLDSLVGTYLRKTGNKYIVIHDQMFDFMCCYFGKKDKMIIGILRYSDIRVINERTQLESVNEQHGKFTIMISRQYEQEYCKRIESELQFGKMNQCFCNSQMKFEKYRALFLDILKSMDDSLLLEHINTYDLVANKEHHEIEYEDYPSDEDMTEGPFLTACIQGYYDIVQYFISKGADINLCGLFGSPLIDACIGGNENIVQLLIDEGSDKNQTNRIGFTPLTISCVKGKEKIVQLLINEGFDINQVDKMGQTPLKASCWTGHEKIVQLLIDKGCIVKQDASIGETPLFAACKVGNEKIVKILIDKICDVNQTTSIGQTPLIAACSGGNEKIVQFLIDKGCDVNQYDGFGETPLTTACSGENEKLVLLLIDKGFDVNQIDGMGHTPLTCACKGGNEKIVQLLIDNGCDVNQDAGIGETTPTASFWRDNERFLQLLLEKGCDVKQDIGIGETPLTAACRGGNKKIVDLLIDKGWEVNPNDSIGETPLTAACRGGNENIVQLLIDKGCNVNQIDGNKDTPLIITCSLGRNEKIVQLLLNQEVNLNQTDRTRQTALTAACKGENDKIVQLLLDEGVNVSEIDMIGHTPLTVAYSRGHDNIVQLLINQGSDVNNSFDTINL
ncbi:uncharacterized protein [Mytilus edulis]|uniref:uncharacterized protein n=1 Tax=Mytilus edulis TaxID=6550 RepID=UPI0039EE9174